MMPLRKQLMGGDPVKVSEISTGQPLPKTVHSMTAYFGAGPIVQALEMGADIGAEFVVSFSSRSQVVNFLSENIAIFHSNDDFFHPKTLYEQKKCHLMIFILRLERKRKRARGK